MSAVGGVGTSGTGGGFGGTGGVGGTGGTGGVGACIDDVVGKFLSEHSTHNSLRDVAVDEMRRIIPKLLMEIDNRNGKTLKKVKGLWDKRPAWWNSDVNFFDPNNRRRSSLERNGSNTGIVKKPTKAELLPVLQYLAAECRAKRQRVSTCDQLSTETTNNEHNIVHDIVSLSNIVQLTETDACSVTSDITCSASTCSASTCSTFTWKGSVSQCSADWQSDMPLTVDLKASIKEDITDVCQQLQQLSLTTCSETQLISTAVDALCGVCLTASDDNLVWWTEQIHVIKLAICLCLRLNYLPRNYVSKLQQLTVEYTQQSVKSTCELNHLPGLVSVSTMPRPSTQIASATSELLFDLQDMMDSDNYMDCESYFGSRQTSNSMELSKANSMEVSSMDLVDFKLLLDSCHVDSIVEMCSEANDTGSHSASSDTVVWPSTSGTVPSDCAQWPSTSGTVSSDWPSTSGCSAFLSEPFQLPSLDSPPTVPTQQTKVPASSVSAPVSRHSSLFLSSSFTQSHAVSDRPNPLDSIVNIIKSSKEKE